MPIKPDCLVQGDTIGIIAPASAAPDPKTIDHAVAFLEQLGFKPKLAPNVRRRWGFLAGNDRERASDLMKIFADRKVKAIICVRGGHGASRLLPRLDYQAIRANPKIFIGYSDITSLHCAFLVKSNLVCFHGPMLSSDFVKQGFPKFTLQSFLRTLTHPLAPGSILDGYKQKTVTILRRGTVSGSLVGGNLTMLCAMLGTPYQPCFKNRILFFEDLDELPYRFDRMLTQLLNAGLLQQVAGIAIGVNANCKDPKARNAREDRQTLEDVLKERLLPLKVPVVAGLPFGHIPFNATLPIGVHATLDAVKGDLVINEPAVQ
ncbi:MAG: LD-carboxypeptidase [Verrucomicrobia bacterium]|nr:LD-carboxypeptidase [Verrucomicrobiota bacterium]